MTAPVIPMAAKAATKGIVAEIEQTLKRWTAAGVDWSDHPAGIGFTPDHKTEVYMNRQGDVAVDRHAVCPSCPVPCAVCRTERRLTDMEEIGLGSRHRTVVLHVCRKCLASGQLANLAAAAQALREQDGDPWNAPF